MAKAKKQASSKRPVKSGKSIGSTGRTTTRSAKLTPAKAASSKAKTATRAVKAAAKAPTRAKAAVRQPVIHKMAAKAVAKTAKSSPTKGKLSAASKGQTPIGAKIAVSSPARPQAANTNGMGTAQPHNKKLNMPTNSKETPKEVMPGGGIVQPATRTAPAMRLRADDAEILATAKERYGRKDLEMFRKLITEQQQDAREEFDILSQNILDTSGEFEADNQTYSLHTAEQGTDAIEREKTFLHAQRTSDYIKKLEEALERIERGTYGICVVCGNLIEKERLQAVPITQKHVDCKNRTQVRKVSNGGGGFHDMEEQPVSLD